MAIYSIYKIKNLVNNKHYIGWTSRSVENRFNEHCSTTPPKYQSRSTISLAIEKHGKENFSCEIIYQSKDYEHSREIETHFIQEYNSLTNSIGGHGYNIDLGGRGHKRSQETIEKHRAKIKGRRQSEEHVRNKANAIRGEKNGMYGVTGKDHPCYGRKPTEEEINRIKATKAKKKAEGWVSTLKGRPGKKWNEEQKASLKDKRPSKYLEVVIQDPSGVIHKFTGKEFIKYAREHVLNCFMSKARKGKKIKGYSLISFVLNPGYKRTS